MSHWPREQATQLGLLLPFVPISPWQPEHRSALSLSCRNPLRGTFSDPRAEANLTASPSALLVP